MTSNIGLIVLAIIGSIGIFVLLREFFCWYYKINEIRNLLKRIVELLEPTKDDIDDQSITTDQSQLVICKRCGSFKKKDGFCPHCGSGWAGKKMSDTLFTELNEFARKEKFDLEGAIKAIVVCRKCGSLKRRDKKCPSCGSNAQ